MSMRRGHEMRKYLVSLSVLVMLLIAGVILYTTIDSVQRINKEMETEKDRVVLSLVDYFSTSLKETSVAGSDPQLMEELFNPELTDNTDISGQLKLLQYVTEIQRAQFAADYMTYVAGGMVLSSSVEEGLDFTDFPTEAPDKGYEILSELGGREGTFISVYEQSDLSPIAEDEFVNLVVDRTEEFNALEDFFASEKSNLIKRQIVIGIVAVAIALLLTTLGVYLLTRRYITGPIEELSDASHRIMEGTFQGDVEVVEDSDYADIQRLLQSGKVLMDKMGEE
ncbi:MAG: hypothetical protein JW854_12580 [Actinobacteria bacterium]|nr:hypothetical protein [Actinomycetota bacterium]